MTTFRFSVPPTPGDPEAILVAIEIMRESVRRYDLSTREYLTSDGGFCIEAIVGDGDPEEICEFRLPPIMVRNDRH